MFLNVVLYGQFDCNLAAEEFALCPSFTAVACTYIGR